MTYTFLALAGHICAAVTLAVEALPARLVYGKKAVGSTLRFRVRVWYKVRVKVTVSDRPRTHCKVQKAASGWCCDHAIRGDLLCRHIYPHLRAYGT